MVQQKQKIVPNNWRRYLIHTKKATIDYDFNKTAQDIQGNR